MYSFKNDYAQGAHPNILQKLIESNMEQQGGYADDVYTQEAVALIKKKINNPAADVYLVTGGTQANLLVIAALLRTHEAVISAHTGHIYANEAGAIESTGHKVIPVETIDGKLSVTAVAATLAQYGMKPHVVKPKLVYISNSTEIGSVYTKAELTALSSYCREQGLYLFMDGARLGHALMSPANDLTMADIAALTDVFYIGATKNGALLGEAIVLNHAAVASDFDYVLKQKGALLAKGRVLGIQFLELFKDDLYFTIAEHANTMALKIAAAIASRNYGFLTVPQSNQIFPILPRSVIDKLAVDYEFFVWKNIDTTHAAIRLITSWATPEEMVDQFIADFIAADKAK